MKIPKHRRKEKFSFWLTVSFTLITFSAALTVSVLQLLSVYFDHDLSGRVLMLLFSFLCTTLVVGAVSIYFKSHLNQCVSGLTRGLEAVAEGDYSVRLDPEEGGALAPAYEHFNKMGEELQGVQTLRKDFINNFSHEFKTPITAIQGFAEILQESDTTEEERRQYLQIILDGSSRLAGLADSALLLTRLDAQQSIPDQAPYSLDEQIKQCVILLTVQWEKKQIAFSAELEEVTYTGNEEIMRHVWLNLLNNAIKYTPVGGEITVTLHTTGDSAVVSVTDTGIGMSDEVQKHIFDKYYQGPPSGKPQGLGLGLSIVHRIVELCGGSVEVSSIVNQGSCFTVRLPKRE